MKNSMVLIIVLVLILLADSTNSRAEVINVPDDFETIQGAIDESNDYDSILVADGTYFENIIIRGRDLTLIGDPENPGGVTIDGSRIERSVVRFIGTNAGEINGFSIINGTRFGEHGGGIYCDAASPRLTNLLIEGNIAGFGGGICCDDNSHAIIEDVVINGNRATYGGGLFCGTSSPTLRNVVIKHNTATQYGGGIDIRWSCNPEFYNVTVVNNEAPRAGGILCFDDADLKLINSTIAGNVAEHEGGGILSLRNSDIWIFNSILWNNSPEQVFINNYEGPDTILFAYNIVQDGYRGADVSDDTEFYWLEGNIDDDPAFYDAEAGNYYLSENSPAIDAGIDIYVDELNGDTLLDLRNVDFIGEMPDLGAIEYDPDNSVNLTEEILPDAFNLYPAFPNPFNSSTKLSYGLPTSTNVSLKVFNLNGRLITTLVDGNQSAGFHSIEWNATEVPSGLYFVRMEADDFITTRKLTLMK